MNKKGAEMPLFYYVPRTGLPACTLFRRAGNLLFSTPNRTRTCDPLLRRQMLYPAELPGHSNFFNKFPGAMLEAACPPIGGSYRGFHVKIMRVKLPR